MRPETRQRQTAQVCLNGHLVNALVEAHPDKNADFCSRCGEPTIKACEHCKALIHGGWFGGRVVYSSQFWKTPAFCPGCGKPYPWIERAILAARDLARELKGLSPSEREELEQAIPDLVKETPNASVAAGRFKRILKKAGHHASELFSKILADVVSETVKKVIFP